MIDRNKLRNEVLETIEIAKRYSLSEIEPELHGIKSMCDNYRVHVLVIGGFSAGKSALLNRLIGKLVLKENIAPETALATELYFSENERVIANYLNGNKIEIHNDEKVNIDQVKNLQYYLNSENLKLLPDYIIVDTPGFDSGIERHNKALTQYIDVGTVFFLVVDCEKGTISESALNFVNEASYYSNDIAIIINKCDKKIQREVEEIKHHIEKLLQVTCGKKFPVICTSIKHDDSGEKLIGLISQFDPQGLYEKNIGSLLNRKRTLIQDTLIALEKNLECNTSNYDEEINKRKTAKCRLLRQLELQKKKINTKLHTEVKTKIINTINTQLVCNVDILANAYRSGIEAFKNRIIQIIRPILICEIEEYSNITYEELVKNLNLECLNQLSDVEDITDILSNIYEKLNGFGESQSVYVPSIREGSEISNIGTSIYKGISSVLAIVTDIVAVPLELLLVFLPDILKIVKSFIGSSGEQQLVAAIQNKVIPQILDNLQTELDKSLIQVESLMITNIEKSINEMIDMENQALETAKNKRNSAVHEYEQFISDIQRDIEQLGGQMYYE